MTGGGRNALTGNCLFLLTLRYLPSLGFAQPVGRQAGAEPGQVTVVGIERYWGRWWGWRDTRGCCCRTAGGGRWTILPISVMESMHPSVKLSLWVFFPQFVVQFLFLC